MTCPSGVKTSTVAESESIEEFLFGFLSLIVERALRCALYGNREGSLRPEPRKVLPGPWERETVCVFVEELGCPAVRALSEGNTLPGLLREKVGIHRPARHNRCQREQKDE
jgi:hypothetical protein